ncbi:MAG: hypothetical protein ACLQOO_14015 [Terriglobia bacterium]
MKTRSPFRRWTKKRFRVRAGLGLALLLASVHCVYGWGPAAHRLVNHAAVQTLPPEMRDFFLANRQFLADHANDPDDWMKKDRNERTRHYIYLDKYGLFPYLSLPHPFRDAVDRYGTGRIGRDGLLPWRIGEYSLKLTNAFKAQNWEEVKQDAAVLAHYIADAHDPLHTTQNYDGQLTLQKGLEARFSSRLAERYANFFMFRADVAVSISDPTEYAFDMVLEANTWVDRIILADRQARDDLTAYTDDYLEHFYNQISSTVMLELNAAAHDAGSYWYSAWANAGRPVLPPR